MLRPHFHLSRHEIGSFNQKEIGKEDRENDPNNQSVPPSFFLSLSSLLSLPSLYTLVHPVALFLVQMISHVDRVRLYFGHSLTVSFLVRSAWTPPTKLRMCNTFEPDSESDSGRLFSFFISIAHFSMLNHPSYHPSIHELFLCTFSFCFAPRFPSRRRLVNAGSSKKRRRFVRALVDHCRPFAPP